MKKILILSILTFAFMGCQDDLLQQVEIEDIQIKASLAASDIQPSSTDLPKITFSANPTNPDLTLIKISDKYLKTNSHVVHAAILLRCRKRPEILTAEWDALIDESLTVLNENPLKLSFEKEIVNEITQYELKYFDEKGNVVRSYESEIFVTKDGVGLLQQPTVKLNKKGVFKMTLLSSGSTLPIEVINDPAQVVKSITIKSVESKESPQLPSEITLTRERDYCCVFFDIYTNDIYYRSFQSGLFGAVILLNTAKKEPVGDLINANLNVVRPSNGRIHSIKIKEEKGGSAFKIVTDVNNVKGESITFVSVNFLKNSQPPLPNPLTAICTIKNELTDKDRTRFIYSPLTFEGNVRPIGATYLVEATRLNFDGKSMGASEILEAVVVANEKELAIKEFSITSRDAKTWTVTVSLPPSESWVENLTVVFEEPFDGAKPSVTKLALAKSVEGMTFTGTLTFDGDPTGSTIFAAVFGNGSGTKNASSQTSTRPTLL